MTQQPFPNGFYRVSVKALITDDRGRILLVKERQPTWSLPGGGLDHGEDPHAGVLRELQEELGLSTATVSDIATIKTFYLEPRLCWLIWVVYRVEINPSQITLAEDVSAAEFIDPATLAESADVYERTVYEVWRATTC